MNRVMRRMLPIAAVVPFLLLPALAGTIGFDSLTPGYGPSPWWPGSPKGDLVTNQYLALGVVFSVDVNGSAYASNSTYNPTVPTGGSSPFTNNFLAFNTTPPNTGTPSLMTITFYEPGNMSNPGWVLGSTIDFWAQDTERNYTVTAYDVNGVQLALVVASGSNDFTHIAFPTLTSSYVHTITLLDVGADGTNLDALNFGPVLTAVPEPGTYLLFGSGLFALGLALRRRRA